MKQREIQPCGMCGKGVMHRGSPLFYGVTMQRMAVNIGAARRQHGLEQMVGHPIIAAVLGPDEDIANPFDEAINVLVCDECAITYPLAAIESHIFSTREQEGGENILKDGQINIGWKTSDQLLPSDVASFREGLTNLLRKFQGNGAQITVATFADGTGAAPVNLVEAGAGAHV